MARVDRSAPPAWRTTTPADSALRMEGINEAASILPVELPVFKIEEIQKIEKKFGFFPVTRIEKVKRRIGVRSASCSEVIKDGNNEQAYQIIYRTIDDKDSKYRDHSNRTGQFFALEILVSKSVAVKVGESLKKNPLFIRMLVEQCALQKLRASKDEWERGGDRLRGIPLNPPYESWRASKGPSRMYIATERMPAAQGKHGVAFMKCRI